MPEYITTSIVEIKGQEELIRCKNCKNWITGIAYEAVGKCKHPNHKGLICNANYYCKDGSARK